MRPGTDLHPPVLFELSNNVPYHHGANLPISCDKPSTCPFSTRVSEHPDISIREVRNLGTCGVAEILRVRYNVVQDHYRSL
jgi:hypothetical protein